MKAVRAGHPESHTNAFDRQSAGSESKGIKRVSEKLLPGCRLAFRAMPKGRKMEDQDLVQALLSGFIAPNVWLGRHFTISALPKNQNFS